MNDFSALAPLDAAALLKRFGLRADKRLGQNFLQDPAALERIVRAAEIQAEDAVLEIGSGLGSLTRYLALAAREVTAIELDPRLIPPLRAVLAPYANVRLLQGDILKTDVSAIVSRPDYLVVANIPYYITSAIMRHLLEGDPARRARRIALTIQKEVAERVCALPGDLSVLALSVQVYGKPSIAGVIPAGAFYPVPAVDSAILRVDVYPQPLIPASNLSSFFKFVKAGFGQKRKNLRNALSAGLRLTPPQAEALLKSAGIDPARRAETLSIEEWARLCREEI
ncbi:MAG: 16S rRNA (adenine(1518)-N(6)/adenine(1519)-N(6))-dimethyltransferase RsmA [Chloroflexi bacterium]|nr:16S rRNA (adenine(1518)-N(6)/adenine(1519)-N(6))-dimethyltransferase RsmA [Chloroflexota bacterium]